MQFHFNLKSHMMAILRLSDIESFIKFDFVEQSAIEKKLFEIGTYFVVIKFLLL